VNKKKKEQLSERGHKKKGDTGKRGSGKTSTCMKNRGSAIIHDEPKLSNKEREEKAAKRKHCSPKAGEVGSYARIRGQRVSFPWFQKDY